MNLFSRYLATSIYKGTLFVLIAFISIFIFFDLMSEMDDVGRGAYQIQHAVAYVVLGLPNSVYELLPIAALIGAMWALSQSAANSEFTVFRVSGLLPRTAVMTMLKTGLPLILITAAFSELLVPVSEDLRSRVRDGALGIQATGQLRSGFWMRDTAPEAPLEAASAITTGMRFINAARLTPDQTLERLNVYEFDEGQRLRRMLTARSAEHLGLSQGHQWMLKDVVETSFEAGGRVTQTKRETLQLVSRLSPQMLSALVTNPERMSALDLYRYVTYLKLNKQQSDRYESAFWKRLIYPFAIWVMLLLALPAAYLQARAGAVGARVFGGILLGVGFHLSNSLFADLGVLTTWPPAVMAALPSLFALLLAGSFIFWVQRR
jgi:lipopolysaccharide export system permease protein